MTTKSTTRKVTLALIVLAIGGTGCGGCLDRDKKAKKAPEEARPQAATLDQYSRHAGRKNLAGDMLGPDAAAVPHAAGEPGTTH